MVVKSFSWGDITDVKEFNEIKLLGLNFMVYVHLSRRKKMINFKEIKPTASIFSVRLYNLQN
jgi:hypothetical protein